MVSTYARLNLRSDAAAVHALSTRNMITGRPSQSEQFVYSDFITFDSVLIDIDRSRAAPARGGRRRGEEAPPSVAVAVAM